MVIFRSRLTTLLTLLVALLSVTAHAQDDSQTDYQARLKGIDEKIEQVMQDFNVPGLALGVVAGGQVVKVKGYGLRDIKNGLPANADTQFPIGSSTKAFTSFVIGTLVDEGKLTWDTPVKQYLPEWKMQVDYATYHTNLKDMLAHRTGLGGHNLIWLGNPDLDGQQIIEKLPHLNLNKGFREGFIYNNLMYAMAGHVAWKVSGQRWETLVQERVLDKLDMNNTSFNYTTMLNTDNYALPYQIRNNTPTQIDYNGSLSEVLWPAGSMNASVKDMVKWLQMLVNKGHYGESSLIDSKTLQTIQSPFNTLTRFSDDADKLPLHYGLGWFIRSFRGHYQVQHGGNIDGFTSAVFTYPNEDLGIVVLSNQNASTVPYLLSMEISELLLDLEPRNHLAQALAEEKAAQTPESENETKQPSGFSMSNEALQAYAGTWNNPGYGKIDITVSNGGLVVDYNGVIEQFVPEKQHQFRSLNTHHLSLFEDDVLVFETNEDGKLNTVNAPFDYPASVRFSR
ncbi:serine hydrolase [Aestuariibacter sp. AA17]|uniref:Serine hydrolase n=1 Tax=Fluctibacter corallii TaxID=2984329 RepID=A0ABT3A8U2_9ALTE|nr:serine hydrolase [Aestuariibacter sp. AA17]MCV2884692.1 serine hydrolase [Aestuariibacter sp. AA17]